MDDYHVRCSEKHKRAGEAQRAGMHSEWPGRAAGVTSYLTRVSRDALQAASVGCKLRVQEGCRA